MDIVWDKYYEFTQFYDWALSISDKRVGDWFLMTGYAPTWALTILYLATIYLGEWFMRNKPAFELRWTLFLYNAGLVALNWHICSELFLAVWALNYNWLCQPVSFTDDPNEMRIASALWWYYFSKLVEFLDTFFFVIRKKNSQVTFLHVYHHATMFPLWWIGVKWVAGGSAFFGAMVNAFIHVVMYTYYGVSALGPKYQKYLWWKKYLTKLQLTQFVFGMAFAVQMVLSGCPHFPKWMQYTGIFYGITMLTLFLNFYHKAYIVRAREQRDGSVKKIMETNGVCNGYIKEVNGNGPLTSNGYCVHKKSE